MSTHSVSDFAASLVEMAEATRRLPIVEAERDELRHTVSTHLDTIQRLELKLMDKNLEIQNHLSTIRSLEVSRDDAELRFLECDDAKSTLERVLRNVIGEASGVLEAVRPVAVEPVAPPVGSVVTGTPNIDSQTNIPEGEAQRAEVTIPRDTYQGVKSDEAPQGQSATDPTSTASEIVTETTTTEASEAGQSADPFLAPIPTVIGSQAAPAGTSVNSDVTPSADATTPHDPEPVKYIGSSFGTSDLNPLWIDWFNRAGRA